MKESPNQALEATADDAVSLPVSTWLLTPSVGGASVLRSVCEFLKRAGE
jgi:hypothetical protein